eukprot:GHVH01010041.1.p1 GENE.GHVH01010041.1~~GHVH01010041.1.p1  ORF type:complete len:513 (-),score=102.08 GHVH01010041.1:82-1620(-)
MLLATLSRGSANANITYESSVSTSWLLNGVVRASAKTSLGPQLSSSSAPLNPLAMCFAIWSHPTSMQSLKQQRFLTGGWNDVDTAGKDKKQLNVHVQAVEDLKKAQDDKKLALAEFNTLADDVGTTGAPIGSYVKLTVKDVPFKWVVHRATNLALPIIAGALLPGETKMGLVQCSIKMHRWNQRQLKSTDPVLVSVGWRRFQTNPTYCIDDRNGVRTRFLKYTPMHTHALAVFAGPAVAPNSGVVFIRNFTNRLTYYSISATGNVQACAAHFNVLKKMKLVGTADTLGGKPRIHSNSAFIKGLFNSPLEAAKCRDCKVQTVSGIRGRIKTAEKQHGVVRCTFEDKIQPNDIVFMKTWVPVPIKSYCNPQIDIPSWRRMLTIAELRHKYQKPSEDASAKAYQARQTRYDLDKPKVRLSQKIKRTLPLDEILKNHVIDDITTKESDADVANATAEMYTPEENERAELKRKLMFIRDDRILKNDKKRKLRDERVLKEKERTSQRIASALAAKKKK